MIKDRIAKVKNMFSDFLLFCLRNAKARQLAEHSLLRARENSNDNGLICPICRKGKLDSFIDIPIGWPMPQNDHLLYFDYNNNDMEFIFKNRKFLEKTMGFCVFVPWQFCDVCRNATLGIKFAEEHLYKYYSQYYDRLAPSSQKRKNTKEQYAKYVDSLIGNRSRLLEVGASEGYAAKYLSSRGHFVSVVEPSKFRDVLSCDKNITVVSNIFELEDGSFDCIYLHHVLEHILDLKGFLRKIYSLLRKEGILIIQVPDIHLQISNYLQSLRFCHFSITNRFKYNKKIINRFFSDGTNSSYWMDALGNNHLYAFTPFGLEYFLKAGNFNIKLIQQTTKDRLIFDPVIHCWPTDRDNGHTPNGVTAVATK